MIWLTIRVAVTDQVLRILFQTFLLFCASCSVFAIGQPRYVDFFPRPDSFRLVVTKAAPVLVDSQDYPGALRVAVDLQTDILRVTGTKPPLITDGSAKATDVVLIGTLGKNRMIDDLVAAGKLQIGSISGHWEAYTVQIVTDPFPGVNEH